MLRPLSLTGSSGLVTLQRLSHAQPATSPVQCRSACQPLKLEVDVTCNASCQALRSHRPSRPGAACECGTAGLGRRRILSTPVSDLRRNRYGRSGAAQLDRRGSSELGLYPERPTNMALPGRSWNSESRSTHRSTREPTKSRETFGPTLFPVRVRGPITLPCFEVTAGATRGPGKLFWGFATLRGFAQLHGILQSDRLPHHQVPLGQGGTAWHWRRS